MERRLGISKAIVAIARKLLVVVWHVLTHEVADRRADAEQVAFKLLRFGIGHDLISIRRGGTPRPLAPISEVLALRPELQQRHEQSARSVG